MSKKLWPEIATSIFKNGLKADKKLLDHWYSGKMDQILLAIKNQEAKNFWDLIGTRVNKEPDDRHLLQRLNDLRQMIYSEEKEIAF